MAPEGVVAFSRFYAPQFTGLVEGPSGNFVAKIKKKKKRKETWILISNSTTVYDTLN